MFQTCNVKYSGLFSYHPQIADEKKKKEEGKKSRLDKERVMEMLYSAFEKHQYYNVKDLVQITKQPIVSIPDSILNPYSVPFQGSIYKQFINVLWLIHVVLDNALQIIPLCKKLKSSVAIVKQVSNIYLGFTQFDIFYIANPSYLVADIKTWQIWYILISQLW